MTSESIEMYLVATAMLRQKHEPVPLSQLAHRLAITPVSANEMCRKLTERGLIEYQPYKGVTLTDEGETVAQHVLRRRRLWEAFLVEHLGIEPGEADEIACRLEHITSDQLVERLAAFLAQPAVPPQAVARARREQSLAALAAGQRGRVVGIKADDVVQGFLQAQGVAPGVELSVLAVAADGAVLLALPGGVLAVARGVAVQVEVLPLLEVEGEVVAPGGARRDAPPGRGRKAEQRALEDCEERMENQITLSQLAVGGQATIVRVAGEKATRRRLMDMGLVRGETITKTRVAPLGDPMEFLVKGYQLSLRKDEASQIIVEVTHATES